MATRAVTAPDPRFVPEAEPPGEGTGGIDWLVEGAALSIAAVTRTRPDTAVWTIPATPSVVVAAAARL